MCEQLAAPYFEALVIPSTIIGSGIQCPAVDGVPNRRGIAYLIEAPDEHSKLGGVCENRGLLITSASLAGHRQFAFSILPHLTSRIAMHCLR